MQEKVKQIQFICLSSCKKKTRLRSGSGTRRAQNPGKSRIVRLIAWVSLIPWDVNVNWGFCTREIRDKNATKRDKNARKGRMQGFLGPYCVSNCKLSFSIPRV